MWLKLPVILAETLADTFIKFSHGHIHLFSHVTAAEIVPCHAFPVTFLSAGHDRPITIVCDYRMMI